jgi:hypothetical protein
MFTSVPEVSTSLPNTVDEKMKDRDKENEKKRCYTKRFTKIDRRGIRLCPYRLFCKDKTSTPDS